MKTQTWSVRRQAIPRRDGERRWDQAYQLLVRWAAVQPAEICPAAPIMQEVPDACRGLCAGLDGPPGAGADYRAAA